MESDLIFAEKLGSKLTHELQLHQCCSVNFVTELRFLKSVLAGKIRQSPLHF